MSHRFSVLIVALLGVLLLAQPTAAMQHLIAPGEDWDDVAAKARPGDEIILMPGRHQAATLVDLAGERGKRIVIRSADPNNPSVIEGRHQGIRLVRPRYVTIENVIVTGASVCGIAIDAQETLFAVTDGELNRERWDCNVKLDNVVIRNTGPTGERHALSCLGVENVEVDDCRFEGWGGAAIEVHGSRNIVVESCWFRGLPEHSQKYGIRVRAGSSSVLVNRCTFENAGTRVISLGGATKPGHFIPPLSTDSEEPGHEARLVGVVRNRITGGDVIFTFDHCAQSMVRNNTIVGPRICVLSLLDSVPEDAAAAPPLGGTSETTIAFNLIEWQPEDLRRLAHASENADPGALRLRSNLWWSPAPPEERAKLGTVPWETDRDPQVMDVDPKLDAELVPTNPDAELYGAEAP